MRPGDPEIDPLEALRRGDPGPFEAFVRSEARRLVGFFVRQGAGLHEAEDLTQEVFLRLHRAAAAYRPNERHRAYVMRIARNAWIDRTRRRAVRPDQRPGTAGEPGADASVLEASLPSTAAGPDERSELREEAARVRAALAELSEGQRMAFELGVVQGMPYEEIGRVLDVPVGTVKSRVFAAVHKVRARLAAPEEGA